MELTKDQQKIEDSIRDWARDPTEFIAIAGYAGTGKTTILGSAVHKLISSDGIKVRLLAPTGKASYVLAGKMQEFGIPVTTDPEAMKRWTSQEVGCSTIHQFLYTVLGVDKTNNYQPIFGRKDIQNEFGSSGIDVVIVDEASMITTEIFRDLLATGFPIIFVGDPGQLPPIDSPPFTPLLNTELFLAKPLRQALDNPIIEIATNIREGYPVEPGFYGDKAAKINKSRAQPFLNEFMKTVGTQDTVMLCAKNDTRVKLNKKTRFVRGFEQPKPMSGERLVCLHNTPSKGLMNGQCVTVDFCEVLEEDMAYRIVVFPEGSDMATEVLAFPSCFHTKRNAEWSEVYYKAKPDIDPFMYDWSHISPLMFFDYGYCLSVHKSQGSEWDRVYLRAERLHADQPDEEFAQWLYTGVTRAKDKLIIATG